MALPKRKHSKSRTRKKRTHKVTLAAVVTRCRQCQAPVRPHNACGKCGYYEGRKVDHTVREEEKKREGRG
ncbi:MAG: 50S ribosomal protein L32 [Armatimonadota bacterium]